jgi:hypothetical protein
MMRSFVVLTVLVSTAAADPSVWSSRRGARYTQFVAPNNGGTEVRIFAPERSTDSLETWASARRRRGPDGVTVDGFKPVASPSPAALVAFARGHRGGASVMIVSVACASGDGMSYAEVIGPEAGFQRDAADALTIAVRPCSAPSASPAAPARATPPSTSLAEPSRAAPVAPAASASPAPDMAAVRGQIVGIGTDETMKVDYSIPLYWYEPQDYLFLRSGWATADFDAILFPGGFDAHRAQHPHQWRRWRKDGDGYKVCSESCGTAKDWKPLRYTKQTLEPLLPKGFRFTGSFKSVGGGTVGDTTALRYGFWTFSADGRFSTSSAASVTVNTWKPSSGTTQVANGGRTSKVSEGTYEVDGPVLTLRYDSGAVVRKILVVWSTAKGRPNTEPSSIRIDGTLFNN